VLDLDTELLRQAVLWYCSFVILIRFLFDDTFPL
jgi:hypothetical protein